MIFYNINRFYIILISPLTRSLKHKKVLSNKVFSWFIDTRRLQNYESESKVLQYFGNVGHNSATSDASAEIGRWLFSRDGKMPNSFHTHQISFYSLKHRLGIYRFRPNKSPKFSQPKRNFLNYLVTAPSSFTQQMFLVASATAFIAQLELLK